MRGAEDRLPETYPGGHPTGGEASNLILKVDPTHSNYIHHVCRVVEGAVCVCVCVEGEEVRAIEVLPL